MKRIQKVLDTPSLLRQAKAIQVEPKSVNAVEGEMHLFNPIPMTSHFMIAYMAEMCIFPYFAVNNGFKAGIEFISQISLCTPNFLKGEQVAKHLTFLFEYNLVKNFDP